MICKNRYSTLSVYTVLIEKANLVVDLNMNSSLDGFHVLRAFL